WSRNKIQNRRADNGVQTFKDKKTREFILGIASLGAGLISSLFGIGGGIVFVPLMLIILELTMNTAAATSHLPLLFTSVVGNLVHISLGHPEYLPAIFLSLGSVVGAQIGAQLSKYVSDTILVKLFSISAMAVSVKLFIDSVDSIYPK